MFQKILLIALLSLTLSAQSHTTHYLFPADNSIAMQDFEKSIKDAKDAIDVAIYSFTHKKIAKALKDAAKKGVKITIIADTKQSRSDYSQLPYLNKYKNISIYLLSGQKAQKGYLGSMHLKSTVIDQKTVFTGSANYSNSAFSIHYENLIKIEDNEVARKYRSMIIKLKEAATPF